MTSIRRWASTKLKERVFNHYKIPFSRFGVNPGLVRFFKPAGPITYIDIGASAGHVEPSIEQQHGIKPEILIEPQPAR